MTDTLDRLHEGGGIFIPKELVDFLCGSAAIDGLWFGEHESNGRGKFWWRRLLKDAPKPLPDGIMNEGYLQAVRAEQAVERKGLTPEQVEAVMKVVEQWVAEDWKESGAQFDFERRIMLQSIDGMIYLYDLRTRLTSL